MSNQHSAGTARESSPIPEVGKVLRVSMRSIAVSQKHLAPAAPSAYSLTQCMAAMHGCILPDSLYQTSAPACWSCTLLKALNTWRQAPKAAARKVLTSHAARTCQAVAFDWSELAGLLRRGEVPSLEDVAEHVQVCLVRHCTSAHRCGVGELPLAPCLPLLGLCKLADCYATGMQGAAELWGFV